ncbi:MAG: ABC transporter substrate-binding protein [Burkholderiales bacterium]|nr:ABC transporter substrate-binding protein [Burkholderiales bacterium]
MNLVRQISSLLATSAVLACAAAASAQTAPQPFKLGYLVDASGPTQGIFRPTLDGFKLYIDEVNRAGGVHGRPIELLVRDVQMDSTRAVSSAQELVSNDVLAVLGLSLTSTHMPVYNALSRTRVPVVTGFPANLSVILPPNARRAVYGVGLVFDITGWAGGELARKVAPTGRSFLCTGFESPGVVVGCDAAMAAAKAQGFTQVDKLLFPVSLRDYRPVADRIAAANPDVVVTALGRGRTLGLLPPLSEAGYKGKVLSMEAGTGDDEVRASAKAAPNLQVYSYSRYASAGQADGPQMRLLTQAAKRAGVDEVLAFHSGGWSLGMVVVDALRRCGANCDASRLNDALQNTRVDTGGLTDEPIVFTKNDHYGRTAYRLYAYDRSADTLKWTGDILRMDGQPKYVAGK